MEAIAEGRSIYYEAFEKRSASGPDWLEACRRKAMDAFERMGVPTKRWEAWRSVDLSAVQNREFRPARGEGRADGADDFASRLGDCYRLVFVDGRLDAGRSELKGLPEGVRLCSLGESLEDGALEADLAAHADSESHPFAALNTAFFEDGVWLSVPAGVVLEKPVLLQFVAREDGATSFPRILVQAGRGAQLRVIEHQLGSEADTLSLPVAELVTAEGANVDYYRLQTQGPGTREIAVVHADLARDARVSVHASSYGGALVRSDFFARLNAPGADLDLNGLYLVEEGQFCDFHTWVDHLGEHGTSRQLFKGVLSGRSEAVFDGLVKVHEGAQKTNAEQQNRNLLLSRRALAHSNPRLEIYADDVKCAHGSTVGELDEEALFYMRARGIDGDAARGLLTFAFAAEVLERVANKPLRDYETALLRAALPGAAPGGAI